MSDSDEDRSGSENEEEDEENDEEEEGSGSGGEEGDDEEENEDDEDGSGSGSGSGSDEDSNDSEGSKKKKKKDEPKLPPPSKYQSIMNTLREINLDLDNIVVDVERVYTKFSTAKKAAKEEQYSQKEQRRNYHGAMDKEEIKRSFSPQRGYNRGYQEQEQDYDDDDVNDRENYYQGRNTLRTERIGA